MATFVFEFDNSGDRCGQGKRVTRSGLFCGGGYEWHKSKKTEIANYTNKERQMREADATFGRLKLYKMACEQPE